MLEVADICLNQLPVSIVGSFVVPDHDLRLQKKQTSCDKKNSDQDNTKEVENLMITTTNK